MRIGIPKETFVGEKRVASTPEVVAKLVKMGFQVSVESGAGALAQFSDEAYQKAGAEVLKDSSAIWSLSDLILKVRAPDQNEIQKMKLDAWLISFIWPAQNTTLMEILKSRKNTVLSMDCVPRISRAQKLDALSSMANIAGYRAVVEAAHHFGRFFTGQVTAAGKIPPAKVFVIGAGVAGLSAIGTASSLGAIVSATDTRPEVADQIKSMGGSFVEVPYKEEGSTGTGYAKVMSEGFQKAQKEMTAKQCAQVDIVITTALIPGKPAPKLITTEMVQSMKQGSVIVDLASEQGGNCELTVPGEVVTRNGVTIIGFSDLPSRLPTQASTLYANNILRLIEELCPQKNGILQLNMQDEMIRGTTVFEQGQLTWPPPPIKVSAAPALSSAAAPAPSHSGGHHSPSSSEKSLLSLIIPFFLGGFVLALAGLFAPAAFLSHVTVFVLACFIGYMVVWNVTPALHTPLMSVTNAVSSIIIVGALILSSSGGSLTGLLGAIAIVLTTINMVGGFAVTQRMLKMFQK